MPALPPVPQVLRFLFKHTAGDDMDVLNRLFFKYSGGPPVDVDLDSIATTAFGLWNTHVSTNFYSGQTLVQCSVEDLTSPTSAIGQHTGSIAGTGGANPMAAGSAFVLQHKVARRYRGGHPRTYLGIFPDNAIATPQTWASPFDTNIASGFNDFVAAMDSIVVAGTSILFPVNVSYYEGFTNFTFPSGRTRPIPKLRVGGPVIDQIIDTTFNPNVGSQRRRNETRG